VTVKLAVQVFAIIAVTIGITYEVMAGAHIGYVLITAGALAFAVSTKIKSR